MDVLPLDDIVAIDRGIDAWICLEGMGYGFDHRCHVGEGKTFALLEGILLCLSPVNEVGDIDLEEACDMGRYLYGLRHAISDDPADRIHGDHPILCTDRDRWGCDLWA